MADYQKRGPCYSFHPRRKTRKLIEELFARLCRFADRHPSPHILGFSTQQHRSEWAAELAPYFRFRWCDQLVSSLPCFATPSPAPFLERLAADLAEEEQWSSRIKPMD